MSEAIGAIPEPRCSSPRGALAGYSGATMVRGTSLALLAVLSLAGSTFACSTSNPATKASTPSLSEALGARCDGVKPQEAPDLMAWDSAARANLDRLRKQGVVAVRYEGKGCDVKLELLPNCRGSGSYRFSPYSARETKKARDSVELFAALPLGANALGGKVQQGRGLRTDAILVGTDALKADARVTRSSLKGPDCPRATHVISTVYLGGFALEADEVKALEAKATVFGVGAGAATSSSAESLAREGDPAACEEALKSGKENPLCSVPLRVGLLALDGLASDGSGVAASAPEKPASGPASCPEGTVKIEGGSFTMGDRREDVGTFCMDKTEVTAASYGACVDQKKCQAPSEKQREFCTYRQAGKEQHPMNCITVDEAKGYCQSRGLLLPTEQQAEQAARGLQGRRYPWGEAEELSRVCIERRKEGTCAVGSIPAGATPEGILDLAGNVAELVEAGRNFRTFGGDFGDRKLKDVSPQERGVATSPSPKVGFRCVTR